MCINQQQKQAVFAEIEQAIQGLEQPYTEQKNGFIDIFADFDRIFREANYANNLPYDQEAGKENQCVFFFPFIDKDSPW